MLKHDLAAATELLRAAGVPSPAADAVLLAAHALGEVSPGQAQAAALRGDPTPAHFMDLVAQRAERVPLQWITGHCDFASVTLKVGPGVFVPRPETEALVAEVLTQIIANYPDNHSLDGAGLTVVDLCAGSGAVACALADRLPAARVYAVELSQTAIGWTRRNAEQYDVTVIHADAGSQLPLPPGQVDVVVANPPYIPPHAIPTDPEVYRHDPHEALYGGGPDGLAVPAAVVRQAQQLLRPGGLFAMEHANTQQDAVLTMLATPSWQHAQGHRDLPGQPRFVTARRGPVGQE